jgi:Tfp pilus assembly protein PilF
MQLVQHPATLLTPGHAVIAAATCASLILQACSRYEAALALKPNSHAALYNWGVALSDLARAVKQASPAEAVAALHLASQKYAESLQLHPRNPQALNNWGLVLQVGWGCCTARERSRGSRRGMQDACSMKTALQQGQAVAG